MSHRKFEHPRHGSLGFLPRKRANRHRGKGLLFFMIYVPTYDAFFMSFYLWKVIGEYFVPVIFVLNGSYCLFSCERAFLIYWLDYLLQLEMNFDFLRSFF